ncbi:chromosome segregation protein SMC [Nocardioides zeae]|uniref:Chromosome partition protein Smc n=1 Tax=Nocardioides imazamoxiresistens TaxID=3231893 RepID=A0ABU3PXC7_9ACTN|nr:chromosome segregation protein SMC [Nocardioides zeae]MDT9593897.1 chromosome segregation protein SMC [Nocardioides zeae]
MYLKSLTLKGFKSFASSTTLLLEPGITCIVGPNGSGKSNVVDALAWVMGEQGAKSLRGGKMEDVIFAGTSGRPPLGRAEVALTIDNADGALPIEYAEVTISRTMFRNGGSEYAINGTACRLLDVQELLSDSGIGREMHVIVGQGQLDSILHATPEDRRGFIEEAAGVLKHRKRKEKALRKLDATEGNLTRLGDLLTEIRRQLKPLGRQAEVARRARTVQADVRDARARLLADDLVTARDALAQELADESVLVERRKEVAAALESARAEEGQVEAALREDLPALAAAQETWFGLAGLRDRIQGTRSLAAERVRTAADAEPAPTSGRDPEQLETEAAKVRENEERIAAEVAAKSAALQQAVERRGEAEEAAAAEERRIATLQRAAADRREGLARLHGQVNVVRSRATAAEDEVGRLTLARADALARAERAEQDLAALEGTVAGLDEGEEGLDAEHETASDLLGGVEERIAELRAAQQGAGQQRAALAARKEALELGLARKDAAGALLAAGDRLDGITGSTAAVLTVRAGHETAVAAALGAAADAVVVEGVGSASAAIELLKADDAGRAGLVVAGGPGAPADPAAGAGRAPLPPGATYVIDVVEAPPAARPALAHLLERHVVVDDLAAARDLLDDHPELVAVTQEGDVLGTHWARGGSQAQPSLLEVQAAVDEATDQLGAADREVERLAADLAQAEGELTGARQRVDAALARLHESDAALAAVAEELAQHGSQARAARGEADRLEKAIAAAEKAREEGVAGLADLERRLAEAESAPDEEPDTTEREERAAAAREARQGEMDARLALRTAEERARAIHGRADALLRQARQEREARARAAERRERVRRQAAAARAVLAGADVTLARLELSVAEAAVVRGRIEEARRGREEHLVAVRARARDLAKEHDELTEGVHRDEMARAQQRMRVEQLEQRAVDELGTDADVLVAEYGPHVPVPVDAPAGAEGDAVDADGGGDGDAHPEPATTPYVRAEQEKRLRSAERALSQLGRVNPLALEEFAAMEERHQFLTEQLEDLRKTRKDLLDIVREVDARVEQVFTEAWEDVRQAFDHVFARLFPGGEGRLLLTDPSDMLTTGVEVEARPPGKKVKRLSLLSGGERSLVAVAFLVALFKARPSPFYILDEVEAALDDTNLGRLLEIYEELRESSQLLVITHQKRTMEVGDALYGVTMRGDGVSAVISQRLREEASA